MKARLRGVIMVLAVVALLMGVFFAWPTSDPVYQGRRLSVWLKEFEKNNQLEAPPATALRHYGRAAEPVLVSLLRAHDTSLGLKLQALLLRQSLVKFQFQPAGDLNLRALRGCSLLGSEVSGTVPAITALLDRSGGHLFSTDAVALNTLAIMGPEGAEALAGELKNPNVNVRIRAAELLGTAPGSATPEVVAALNQCAGSDGRIKSLCERSLKLIQARLAQHIPASATNWAEAPDPAASQPYSVWDCGTGLRILTNSALEQWSGTWRTEDLFGAHLGQTPAAWLRQIAFDNSHPDGFIHFIEWETPQAATLRSFGFITANDSTEFGFQRSLRTIRLYARAGPADEFRQIYAEELTVPYGTGYNSSILFLFRNFDAPVSARQFRAEFVQNGAGPWHGSRVLALYGFTSPLNWPMLSGALANQAPEVQSEARQFFGK